jgi:hypothetical protein
VDVYICFAFFAAQLAYKMGEWRTIVGATILWSIAMLALGPLPTYTHTHTHTPTQSLAVAVCALVVLGATETFVFLPFIPVFHR